MVAEAGNTWSIHARGITKIPPRFLVKSKSYLFIAYECILRLPEQSVPANQGFPIECLLRQIDIKAALDFGCSVELLHILGKINEANDTSPNLEQKKSQASVLMRQLTCDPLLRDALHGIRNRAGIRRRSGSFRGRCGAQGLLFRFGGPASSPSGFASLSPPFCATADVPSLKVGR